MFAVGVIVETLVLQAIFAAYFFRHPGSAIGPISMMTLFITSIVVFVAVSLLFAYYPANLFDYVGSINTIVAYIILAYIFLGGLFYYGRATGMPWAAILLVWVVGINAWGINNSHVVPARDIASTPLKGKQQFLKWLQARRDRAAYATQDYPVYIVASAGGGIYASMRTGLFPRFPAAEMPGLRASYLRHQWRVRRRSRRAGFRLAAAEP